MMQNQRRKLYTECQITPSIYIIWLTGISSADTIYEIKSPAAGFIVKLANNTYDKAYS